MKVRIKKFMFTFFCISLVTGITALFILKGRVDQVAAPLTQSLDSVDPSPAALIFGAYVYPDGTPCPVLQDRLLTGLSLYRSGKVDKLLLTGDHGQSGYDEVNGMKEFLERQGVPSDDLFLDHAGFDTYDSLYRARDIFGLKKVTLVTQSFHLKRALYIGNSLGLEVQGVPSDLRKIPEIKSLERREVAANVKAFMDLVRKRPPVHLGSPISMDESSSQTHDK